MCKPRESEYEMTINETEDLILPLIGRLDNPVIYEVCLEVIEDRLESSHLSTEEKEEVALYFEQEYGLAPNLWDDEDDI